MTDTDEFYGVLSKHLHDTRKNKKKNIERIQELVEQKGK